MKMTPEEFLAANPEAVAAWQKTAADEAREAQIQSLNALTAAFPDRWPFAVACFVEGKSLLEAKAALSDVLTEENATLKLEATQLAASAPAPKPNVTLEALAAQAPGVGFSGGDADREAPTFETLWEDPAVQAEFLGNKNAFRIAAARGLIKELN